MNQNSSYKSLFNFFTRAAILVLAFILTYHFTVGISLTKIDKIADQIAWIREKAKSIDKESLQRGLYKMPTEINLSEEEKIKLGDSTRQVLKSLAPIIDEFYLYEPKSKQ